jgi:N-acetyl-alpha-D-muramate 1-phosphate uridylyltransferase
VGVYHPHLFQNVVRGQPAKLAPLLKTAMQQALVSGQHHNGVWHDIGTPERLQQIDAWLNTTKDQGYA